MQFTVRTFDAANAAYAERHVEGDSAEDVRLALERQGLTVLAVAAPVRRLAWSRRPTFDVLLFCDELRTLLSSGMSLVEAIDTLSSKDRSGYKHEVLREVQQQLLEGKPFSSALQGSRFRFPLLLIASLRASERSSRVDEALDEFVAYEQAGRDLRRKIVSAAIYPALVVGFGMLVSLFMLSYVVPRFSRVYEDVAHGISTPTRILIAAGSFLGDHLALVFVAAAAALAAIVVSWRSGRLARAVLGCCGRFRLTRHYLRLYQLSRIYQTMTMLLRGGFTVSDAIPLARNLAFETALRAQLLDAARALAEGRRLSQAFAEHGLTDHVSVRLLQVGERSGNLAHTMAIIGQTYRQELMLFIERMARIAEPLLLMVVGLLIGAMIILMYMPVFDLAGGM